MTAATVATHPGDTCRHTWSTAALCTARCTGVDHRCTVDRATHGTDCVCCCGATAPAPRCWHCHDDPPAGHGCPRCGATTTRERTTR